MGIYSTISATDFPRQEEFRIGKTENVVIEFSAANKVEYDFAVVLRADLEEPGRTLYLLPGENFPDNKDRYYDKLGFKEHFNRNDSFMRDSTSKFCCEGKEMLVCFHFRTKESLRALCVCDRGPYMFFKILEGVHEGKFISAGECQYTHV